MFNMYGGEITEFRHEYCRVHPSSRPFSGLTRIPFYVANYKCANYHYDHLFFCFSESPVLIAIGFVLLAWLMFATGRYYAQTYKMKGFKYNDHLLPLEKRYHRMSKKDRKECRGYLESAYQMCSKKGELDKTRLKKIEELFRHKEISNNILYDALDQELALAKEIAKVRQEAQKEIDDISKRVN